MINRKVTFGNQICSYINMILMLRIVMTTCALFENYTAQEISEINAQISDKSHKLL